MITIDQNNFQNTVMESQLPVLVDFWAPWCGPCRMVAPIVEEIAAEFEGKIQVGKINVDENQELAGQFAVMSIPTLCLFVKGNPVLRLVGFRQKRELVAEITKHLA
ncbi:thioredoxin [Hydrogenispora ethanolica]|uniref:Thioredoxin n=1 Tax=Hydrogenispora ethanolica TaxID=1082276 RepID=A0A4R1RB52_HYDET|nr:thioredoxin [Hydrogenispora ethanolica]TCL63004.1 thioredoxin [Hydrogenispora ethanolica]